jgi:hypothetical protein
VSRVFTEKGPLVESEILAREIAQGEVDWADSVEFKLEGEEFRLWIQKAE